MPMSPESLLELWLIVSCVCFVVWVIVAYSVNRTTLLYIGGSTKQSFKVNTIQAPTLGSRSLEMAFQYKRSTYLFRFQLTPLGNVIPTIVLGWLLLLLFITPLGRIRNLRMIKTLPAKIDDKLTGELCDYVYNLVD